MSGRLEQLLADVAEAPWEYRAEDGIVLDAEQYFVVQVHGSPTHPTLAASGELVALAPEMARLQLDTAGTLRPIAEGPCWFTREGLHDPEDICEDRRPPEQWCIRCTIAALLARLDAVGENTG